MATKSTVITSTHDGQVVAEVVATDGSGRKKTVNLNAGDNTIPGEWALIVESDVLSVDYTGADEPVVSSSYRNGGLLTEHDTNTFEATDAVYVGGAGNLVVMLADMDPEGDPLTIAAPAGATIPISIVQLQTASTATGVVGLYH